MGLRYRMVSRPVMLAFVASVLLVACGGGALSLTEYVDRVNELGERTSPQAETLIAELERSTTPAEVGVTMDRMVELRVTSLAAAEALDPPEQIAELHELYTGWEARLLLVEEALAARAGAVSGWEELFASAEVKAYRAALVEGKQVCIEFQERLDATADRGVFAEVDWLPSELKEGVDAVLGCEIFPEDPESVFRPAPTPPSE